MTRKKIFFCGMDKLHRLKIFIPGNGHRVKERYYSFNEIVNLLRKHRNNPGTIQFLADMLEV